MYKLGQGEEERIEEGSMGSEDDELDRNTTLTL